MQKLNKIKNTAIAVVFLVIIFGYSIAGIFYEAGDVLESERRVPESFPEFSFDTIKDASFMNKLEDYMLDNFPMREEFRKIKAMALFNVFLQKDNNSVYEVDGFLSKYEGTFSESSVIGAGKKFEKLANGILKDLNVYMAVIPDKNFFMAGENGYPEYDYRKFAELVKENAPSVSYIDLFDSVKLEDFYKTDLHWDQSKIGAVIDKLASEMGFVRADTDFKFNEKDGFYGNFAGQIALPVPSEKLTYLTSTTLDAAKVYIMNEKTLQFEEAKMYDDADYENVDPYDFFLNGPTALIKIVNENCESDKRLILFRDSFGSSAAPLLVDGYSEVYIVDLRYMSSGSLPSLIELRPGDDALLLYSTSVLNNSGALRVF